MKKSREEGEGGEGQMISCLLVLVSFSLEDLRMFFWVWDKD